MIVDRIDQADCYQGLGERIATGLAWLQETDLLALTPGEYEIDGREIFAVVNDYALKPRDEGRLEAHRRYIDIQYLARGREQIGYAPLREQPETVPFDEGADLGFYAGEAELVSVSEGMFAIFYPHDLHMPGIGDPANAVRKVVVKVRT